MHGWLRGLFGFEFDFAEFYFGLAVGAALSYFIVRLLPSTLRGAGWLKTVWQRLSESLTAGATDRFRVDVAHRAQGLHLARAIFTLDEILVPPCLLVPPQPINPQAKEPIPQEMLGIIPGLPDLAQITGRYRAPTIPLFQALNSGVNLLITGEPGSGKTTALAYLASRCARRHTEAGAAAELMPVMVHAADLRLEKRTSKDPLDPLIAAAQRSASAAIASRLPSFLHLQFRQQRALLLLDGLDELVSEEILLISPWLKELQEAYPGNRIVAAGPTTGYDGLARAGLAPATIAPWGAHEVRAFLSRWSESWSEHIQPSLPKSKLGDLDPLLINGWIISSTRGLTPMDLTLRVWAAFGGDARGRSTTDGLEAYVARFLSPDERPLAEAAALNWLNERKGAVAERTLPRGTPTGDLVEAGIFVRRAEGRLSFFHPVVGAYLAARAMAQSGLTEAVARPGWSPAETALAYFAASGDLGPLVHSHLQTVGDPLDSGVFICAPWLREAPSKAQWKGQLMRAVGTVMQDHRRAYGQRLRALQALASAADASVAVLFRRLMGSEHASSRIIGALGIGLVRDEESVDVLVKQMAEDRDLEARQAACLGLAAVGSDVALESLGRALLGAEEGVRLAAAEALACHPDEGYGMLKEAAALDNLLTRRAAVFGLARIPEPWVLEILERVQTDDKQWVVRGAAAEAFERRHKAPWRIPAPVDEPAMLPWLVAFAAREGSGVAPGKAALEILRRALATGTPEEKLAAVEALAWLDSADFAMDLYQALGSSEPTLRDAAFETLWRQAAAGVALPSTEQFGSRG
jgi:HEAT repeat protein